jgi:hypothetical protein
MSEFKAGMDWNEEQPLDDYRTISRAAVVSLALTLLALLAFASPVLWIVPVLSGFAAVVALRGIRANESLAGGGVAVVAIFLSTFILFAAPARHLSRRNTLANHAQRHVQSWCSLVREGKLPEAFELTLEYSKRNPLGIDLESLYGPQKIELNIPDPAMRKDAMSRIRTKQQELDKFFGETAAATVVASDAPPKFVRLLAANQRHGADAVYLHYTLPSPEHGKPDDVLVFELERRALSAIGESHWRVVNLHMMQRLTKKLN